MISNIQYETIPRQILKHLSVSFALLLLTNQIGLQSVQSWENGSGNNVDNSLAGRPGVSILIGDVVNEA